MLFFIYLEMFLKVNWSINADISALKMKREGLEPSTLGLEDRCSIQLSYRFRQVIVYNFTSIIVNVV